MAAWAALHPWIMQTSSHRLRLAGSPLSLFLFLPDGMCHYRCCGMQGDASVFGSTWPCYFLMGRGLASCLRTTHHLSGYLHRQGRWASFLYRKQTGALPDRYLARLFRQVRAFFLPRPENDCFHAADVQRDPAISSSALPAPPISSPCLNANE